MRKLLTLLFVSANIVSFAANLNEEVRNGYTLANDNYSGIFADIPEVREIYGGTVFKVTFDEDCPVELQSAFNYACKIWEENVLTCPPINISVSVDKIRTFGSDKALSNVRYRVIYFENELDDTYATLSTNAKYTILRENLYRNNIHFVSDIDSADFFDLPDIQIVYNEDCLDEFSYNLESEPEYGYYDFVTLALRDIAKGLGFEHSILADTSNGRIVFPANRLTPYETMIQNAMGTNDPYVAYQSCTNGTFPINITGYSWQKDDYGTVQLYAPNPWTDNASLQYFIPDERKPFTQLLTYDFCKGYVMRNISDEYDKLLPQALGWTYDVAVGGNSASTNESGNSIDVLPFKGTVSFPNYSKSINEQVVLCQNQESKQKMYPQQNGNILMSMNFASHI